MKKLIIAGAALALAAAAGMAHAGDSYSSYPSGSGYVIVGGVVYPAASFTYTGGLPAGATPINTNTLVVQPLPVGTNPPVTVVARPPMPRYKRD